MSAWSQFDKRTGRFTSQIINGCVPQEDDTHGWREGVFDHNRFAIDVVTLAVIACEPPPQNDSKRNRRRALALIADIERRQARTLREVALSRPGATERLEALDAQIVELRKAITVETETTAP